MKRKGVLMGVGLALLMTTGCSGEPGEALPASEPPGMSESVSVEQTAPPQDSGLPHSGAPAVTDPLPESVLSEHPCEVLTPEQVRQALGPGELESKPGDSPELGPGCHWGNRDTLGGFLIGFNTVTRQGLSATYANVKPQDVIFREIGKVEGFPAVSYTASENDRVCTVVVGLADEYSIASTIGLSPEKEAEGVGSCVSAARIAEMVVGNLKAKAGR